MNILLINQPLNNRGDESAHKGFVRRICEKVPSANIKVLFIGVNQKSIDQIKVYSTNVEYINLESAKGYQSIVKYGLIYSLFPICKFFPIIEKIITIYKYADVVVCAPGEICMGGFQNWEHLFLLKIAKSLKKPLIYYGRSFGPFPELTTANRVFKKISFDMLHYFSFLSIRDKKTELLADSLGLQYFSTVDSAFLDSPKVEIPKNVKMKIGEKKYMVFVPNLLIWHYAYKNKISKEIVIDFFRSVISIITNYYPDYNIIMLPQTFNFDNPGRGDINFFYDLTSDLKDPRIIILEDKYSSDLQQTVISNAEFLIGARYHSIVFAINNNVPFIALSYEHKISGLLKSLGKENCMVDITELSMNREQNLQLLERVKDLLPKIHKDSVVREKAKNIAYDCFEKFLLFLKNEKLVK